MARKIRVLVGKPGLDGHDRGAKVVAAALRDAGMEVIYTGLHQTPEQIVEAAVQEDVDVVALSVLSGAHMTLFPVIQKLMNEAGIGDQLLTGGGIIPSDDVQALMAQGVGRLFGPGTNTADIITYIRAWYADRHGAEALPPLPPPPPRPEPVVGSEELAHHRPRAARAAAEVPARAQSPAKPAAKRAAKQPAKKVAKKAAKRSVKKAPAKKAPARKTARKKPAPAKKQAARRSAPGRRKVAKKKAGRR
jgi:methylmalonyl-CoA mutase C-terminal domain/subunit